MHLAPHSAKSTTTTTTAATGAAVKSSVGASCLPAGRATLGFVGITFVRMILLVVSSKYERLVALNAGQVSVLKR